MGAVLDDDLLAMPEIQQAIESGTDASVSITINNVDRSSTGRLGGRVAAKYGDKGFPATININMQVSMINQEVLSMSGPALGYRTCCLV